jgi:hypothetical protein
MDKSKLNLSTQRVDLLVEVPSTEKESLKEDAEIIRKAAEESHQKFGKTLRQIQEENLRRETLWKIWLKKQMGQ